MRLHEIKITVNNHEDPMSKFTAQQRKYTESCREITSPDELRSEITYYSSGGIAIRSGGRLCSRDPRENGWFEFE